MTKVGKILFEYLTEGRETEVGLIDEKQFKKIEEMLAATTNDPELREDILEVTDYFIKNVYRQILSLYIPDVENIAAKITRFEKTMKKVNPNVLRLLGPHKLFEETSKLSSTIKKWKELSEKKKGAPSNRALDNLVMGLGLIWQSAKRKRITRIRYHYREVPVGGPFFDFVKFILKCLYADSLWTDQSIDESIKKAQKDPEIRLIKS